MSEVVRDFTKTSVIHIDFDMPYQFQVSHPQHLMAIAHTRKLYLRFVPQKSKLYEEMSSPTKF